MRERERERRVTQLEVALSRAVTFFPRVSRSSSLVPLSFLVLSAFPFRSRLILSGQEKLQLFYSMSIAIERVYGCKCNVFAGTSRVTALFFLVVFPLSRPRFLLSFSFFFIFHLKIDREVRARERTSMSQGARTGRGIGLLLIVHKFHHRAVVLPAV